MSLILYAMMNLDSKFLGDTFTSVSFILFFFLFQKHLLEFLNVF